MKKIVSIIMLIAIVLAIYEQSKPDKNVYVMSISIAVFVFGMIQLSAKTPSKNNENQDNNV